MSYVTPGLGRGGTLGGSSWSLAMFIQDSYKVGNAVVLPHWKKYHFQLKYCMRPWLILSSAPRIARIYLVPIGGEEKFDPLT